MTDNKHADERGPLDKLVALLLRLDWLDVLGRIRQAGKLCQVYVTPEGAIKIVRELGGKGFALVVGTAPKDDQEAEDFLSALAAADCGSV